MSVSVIYYLKYLTVSYNSLEGFKFLFELYSRNKYGGESLTQDIQNGF